MQRFSSTLQRYPGGQSRVLQVHRCALRMEAFVFGHDGAGPMHELELARQKWPAAHCRSPQVHSFMFSDSPLAKGQGGCGARQTSSARLGLQMDPGSQTYASGPHAHLGQLMSRPRFLWHAGGGGRHELLSPSQMLPALHCRTRSPQEHAFGFTLFAD